MLVGFNDVFNKREQIKTASDVGVVDSEQVDA